MTNPNNLDLTEDRLFFLGTGLIYRCVCAPKTWTAEQVSSDTTRRDPPGTSNNEWVISEPDDEREDPFKGVSNVQCPDDVNRTHWLLNC